LCCCCCWQSACLTHAVANKISRSFFVERIPSGAKAVRRLNLLEWIQRPYEVVQGLNSSTPSGVIPALSACNVRSGRHICQLCSVLSVTAWT
jgi:hypothetical protein